MSAAPSPLALDGNSLTLEAFATVVDGGAAVSLAPHARERVAKARAVVEKAAKSSELVYSINTGFGALSRVRIDPDQLEQLQLNFIRSHCCSVGEPHSERESRAILLLRANALAKGFSGVRVELLERLLQMLNRRVHPVIPMKGSVGSSGDLSPLAHLASVLIGEGEALYEGERLPGAVALERAGIQPVVLGAKEGLALVNGTQQMTAIAALSLLSLERLADVADLVCVTTLDGILGSHRAYTDWMHEARPLPGQVRAASQLRRLSADSRIYESHLKCNRVQDPYSVRCAPQVHGAVRDLLRFVRETLSVEINAATDNPLVNPDTNEIISGGNFHGQPIAFALDILGMAASELGSISERRIVKLVNPTFSELPAFLVKNEGLNSGFMIPQYTAAHLLVESRLLTHPASTDNVPVSNEKEDHNSMGPIAAMKLKTILANAEVILAIEALTACQALEFRKPLEPSVGARLLYDLVRTRVPALDTDRYLHKDIDTVTALIRSGEIGRRLDEKGLL